MGIRENRHGRCGGPGLRAGSVGRAPGWPPGVALRLLWAPRAELKLGTGGGAGPCGGACGGVARCAQSPRGAPASPAWLEAPFRQSRPGPPCGVQGQRRAGVSGVFHKRCPAGTPCAVGAPGCPGAPATEAPDSLWERKGDLGPGAKLPALPALPSTPPATSGGLEGRRLPRPHRGGLDLGGERTWGPNIPRHGLPGQQEEPRPPRQTPSSGALGRMPDAPRGRACPGVHAACLPIRFWSGSSPGLAVLCLRTPPARVWASARTRA